MGFNGPPPLALFLWIEIFLRRVEFSLQELLRLSDEVVKELLYIEDFASRRIYFRRLRVPPLVTVYWRHIVANHFMRKFMRCYVSDGRRVVKQGFRALKKIRRMEALAGQLGLPAEDLRFQYDTFEIIADRKSTRLNSSHYS